MVLKIVGIVAAVVVLVIVALLFIPVQILIEKTVKTDIKVKLKVLFLTIDIHQADKPAKQQTKTKKKAKKKKDSTFSKAFKKLFGVSNFTPQENAPKKDGLADTVSAAIDTIKVWMSSARWFVKRIKIRRLNITCVCAGSDASETAIEYGMMCAVLYPFLGFLQVSIKMNKNAVDVNVLCDYDAGKSRFEFDTVVAFKPIDALRAVIKIVRNNI